MKAVKATGMINDQGLLCLDSPLNITAQSRVEVIVLVPEGLEAISEPDDDDIDESVDEIKASLRQALHEVQSGQLIPLAQLWDGIETNAD
jgi:hypothetical protein